MEDKTDKLWVKYSTVINTLEAFNRCTWTFGIQEGGDEKPELDVFSSHSCGLLDFLVVKGVPLSGISWFCNPSSKISDQQIKLKGLD